MSRPKRKRTIESPPMMEGFKPFGIPMMNLEPVILLFEEYEAIRLADYEDLSQEESAKLMNVSRPTFTRIYKDARQTISRAFIEGKAILIEGGNYHTEDFWYRCDTCLELNIYQVETNTCNYCSSLSLRRLNKTIKTNVSK
ncbi:DUF134 domain-containing protein [Bacteroidota bacterium]